MTRRSAPLIPALLALLAVSAALVTLRRCTDRGEPELPAAPATDAEDRSTGATEPTASTRAAARLGAQLLGRVVDDQGEPIGGALVTLVQSGRENAQVTARQITARTDASGAYELRGLPTGPLGVRAAAAGHATMQMGDLRPDRAPDQRLVVRALQLPRAVRYHGRVSCEGRGLADVEVRVLPQLKQRLAAARVVEAVLVRVRRRHPLTNGRAIRSRVRGVARGEEPRCEPVRERCVSFLTAVVHIYGCAKIYVALKTVTFNC